MLGFKLAATVSLVWLEPGRYRFAVYRERGVIGRCRRFSIGSAPVIFGVMAILNLVQAEPVGWPKMMGLAAILWFLFLLLIWMTTIFPANVFIHDDGINRNFRQMTNFVRQSWTWDQVASCQLGYRRIGERSHPALWIIAPGGTTTGVIGIDHRTSETAIRTALAKYGKEVRGTLVR